MKRVCSIAFAALLAFALTGCSGAPAVGEPTEISALREVAARATDGEMFSKRDRATGVDADGLVDIVLEGSAARAADDAVDVSGPVITIRDEGAYRISGELAGSIVVDAPDDALVHLVLDGAHVQGGTAAALFIKEADKVFVTLADGSDNTLSSAGPIAAVGKTDVDGAVFSRRDLTFNGSGALTVESPAGHGIVCNRDLVFFGGAYRVSGALHALKARDSVRAGGGAALVLAGGKDGIHVKDDDDPTTGFAYISDATLEVAADDDGISTESDLLVAGGDLAVEAASDALHTNASIAITGGALQLVAQGVALHADVALLVSGGSVDVSESGGDTDAPWVAWE